MQEAKEIDDKNGNRLWQEAIDLEIKNVRVAFKVCEGYPKNLVSYT